MKTCTGCGESKPLGEFYLRGDAPQKRRHHCKGCKKAYAANYFQRNKTRCLTQRKQYYENHRNAVIEQTRWWAIQKKYHLSQEEYMAILDEQEGVCRICKGVDPNKMLAVDHDHQTGQRRGLLCFRCNTSLATFEQHRHAILQYLETFA